MKRYLMIGDYRTCENYGSIATCEQVIELMRPRRLTIIPVTRMDQDYEYVPLYFNQFDDYANKVIKGSELIKENRAINNSDKVIIHGEGALTHHTNAVRCEGKYRARTRYILFLAYYAAKYCKKEVSIINHCVDPGNLSAEEMIRNVYPLINECWVRDQMSKENLKKLNINFSEYVPDALYNFEHKQKINEKREYICIGDTATLGYADWNISNFFEKIIYKLKENYKKIFFIDGNMWKTTDEIQNLCNKLKVEWIHVDNTSWQDVAKIFLKSKYFFSGRWHASILSILSGCAPIVYGTDSHKTLALFKELSIQKRFYELNDLPKYLDEIIDQLTNSKTNYETRLFEYAKKQRNILKGYYHKI